MKKFIILSALLPFIIINGQQPKFNFNIDFANFKYDTSSNYVEFYYSFPQDKLKPVMKDGHQVITGLFHLELNNTDTKQDILNKTWKIPYQVEDTALLHMQKDIVGVIGFVVPGGKYSCTAVGSDMNNSDMKKSVVFPVNVTPFDDSTISLSDIQVASSIRQSEAKNSIFYKNSYEVIPYPVNIFGENEPVIFYYNEVYNLDKYPDLKKLTMQVIVTNSLGKAVFNRGRRFMGSYSANVNVGTINASKLPSGKYSVYLALNDSSKNITGIRKDVYVYNPGIKDTTTFAGNVGGVLSSQFAALSQEECDNYFDKAKYIANRSDKEQYKKLQTVEGKRKFLFQFWNRESMDSTNIVKNDFTTYMNRVRIANERYKHLGMEGWKTDRGRVYILYGEPSEIDRHPNESNKNPYVIWRYNDLEGGVQFIFGDLTGFNNYILLSSTKRGEINDPNWEQRITPNY